MNLLVIKEIKNKPYEEGQDENYTENTAVYSLTLDKMDKAFLKNSKGKIKEAKQYCLTVLKNNKIERTTPPIIEPNEILTYSGIHILDNYILNNGKIVSLYVISGGKNNLERGIVLH